MTNVRSATLRLQQVKALLEQRGCRRQSSQERNDAFGAVAVAVWIHDTAAVELERLVDCRADGRALGRAVKHRGCRQAAALAIADIDGRNAERRRLVETTRGIADDRVHLRHQAQVAPLAQRGVDMATRRTRRGPGLESLRDRAPAGVGVRSREPHDSPWIETIECREQLAEVPLAATGLERL